MKKGPSKFIKDLSSQYQLALMKSFRKMRERNARRPAETFTEKIIRLNKLAPITNKDQYKLAKLIDYYAINHPDFLERKFTITN